jgi:hypothetical protein
MRGNNHRPEITETVRRTGVLPVLRACRVRRCDAIENLYTVPKDADGQAVAFSLQSVSAIAFNIRDIL